MLGILLLLTIAEEVSLPPVIGQGAALYHKHIEVRAGRCYHIPIYVREPGTTITIKAYIYTAAWSWSDIDIEIIGSGGIIELAKHKYRGVFKYEFTAYTTGVYDLVLDNSYSTLTSKIVDLAYVENPPPTTTYIITKTKAITSTRTIAGISMENLPSIAVITIVLLIIGLTIGYLIGRRRVGAK